MTIFLFYCKRNLFSCTINMLMTWNKNSFSANFAIFISNYKTTSIIFCCKIIFHKLINFILFNLHNCCIIKFRIISRIIIISFFPCISCTIINYNTYISIFCININFHVTIWICININIKITF